MIEQTKFTTARTSITTALTTVQADHIIDTTHSADYRIIITKSVLYTLLRRRCVDHWDDPSSYVS